MCKFINIFLKICTYRVRTSFVKFCELQLKCFLAWKVIESLLLLFIKCTIMKTQDMEGAYFNLNLGHLN